jgi:hypothetical protein
MTCRCGGSMRSGGSVHRDLGDRKPGEADGGDDEHGEARGGNGREVRRRLRGQAERGDRVRKDEGDETERSEDETQASVMTSREAQTVEPGSGD